MVRALKCFLASHAQRQALEAGPLWAGVVFCARPNTEGGELGPLVK